MVVGSYERGDRAVTVSRLAELADFYRVPVAELLPDGSGDPPGRAPARSSLDLEKLYDQTAEDLAYVAKYARAIQQQRGDYNGRVLSIRADDLRALAIVYDASPSGLVERLDRARRPGRRPARVLRDRLPVTDAPGPGRPEAGPSIGVAAVRRRSAGGVLGDPAEQAVEEARRVVGRQLAWPARRPR